MAAVHFSLSLKPILLWVPPESTALQEQLESALANLFLRDRRKRSLFLAHVGRLGYGSLLGTGILFHSRRIGCLFGSWHKKTNSFYQNCALARVTTSIYKYKRFAGILVYGE